MLANINCCAVFSENSNFLRITKVYINDQYSLTFQCQNSISVEYLYQQISFAPITIIDRTVWLNAYSAHGKSS